MKVKKYLSGLFWVVMAFVTSVSCTKDGNVPETNNPDPEPASGPYKITLSAGYAEADNEEVTTRATLNLSNGVYYWDPGDRIGLFITGVTSHSPILNNIPLDGTHTGQVAHTTFTGSLNSGQIGALSSGNYYDYYSYFPYNGGLAGTFPTIQFQTPSAITVSPNTFKPINMDIPMVAEAWNQPPVFFLDGYGVAQYQMLHCSYKHVMSYAAIEMDCKLLSETVTSITITNNNGTPLWGNYNYNMIAGAGSFSGGNNSLTINISGGLTVGGGGVIYIPMPPVNMSGQTLTFQFNTGNTTNSYINKTINGIDFKRGRIHYLRIAPSAKYEGSMNFTTTIAGYYFIEAWGGDGGNGGSTTGLMSDSNGGSGNIGQRRVGLYSLNADETIYVQVGTAGGHGGDNNGAGSGSGGAAGTAGIGTYFGAGYIGGKGGDGSSFAWTGGAGGGGGGAASGVLLNGTGVANIIMASGGAGGGGGGSATNKGGNGGITGANGGGGDGGASGGNDWSTTTTNGIAFGNGQRHDGINGSMGRGGGGAGGGGGGWNSSTGGGAKSGVGGSQPNGGGGGAGGISTGNTTNPGFTFPTNSRPAGRRNGYVVITFFRP